MNKSILQDTIQKTLAGTITFPNVVQTCISEGVESYHADLICHEYRFYNSTGDTYVETWKQNHAQPSLEFKASGVQEAVKSSQSGKIKYKEFIDRILQAGCVYYIVYLNGRKVVYCGRNGETHTEYFPN